MAVLLPVVAFADDAPRPLDKAKARRDPQDKRLGQAVDRLLSQPIFGATFKAAKDGVAVGLVLPLTPAQRMGLSPGDVITSAWGQDLRSPKALQALIRSKQRGDDVVLSVRREDGWVDKLKGRLGRRPFKLLSKKTGRFVLGVVLIDFPDAPHRKEWGPKSFEQALFSRETYNKVSPTGDAVFGSMADYFHENSAGRFQLTGKVFDWVRMPQKKSFYDRLPQPLGSPLMLSKALDLVIDRAETNPFDDVDGIAFINAGGSGSFGRVLWPHSSVLFHRGRLYDYYLMEAGEKRFAPIGVHCHEFGHVLGILDKYGLGRQTGLGCFCAMAVGHRGSALGRVPLESPKRSPEAVLKEIFERQVKDIRKQFEDLLGGPKAPHEKPGVNARPLHFCAHCKMRFGWLDPVTVDPRVPQTLVLDAVEGNGKAALKVLLDPRGREYFLLEYRRKVGFDRGLPASGLVIWHVGDQRAPLKNFVPFSSLELEEAHGSDGVDGAHRAPERVPFGRHGRTAFTPETQPSSRGTRAGAWPVWIQDIRERGGKLTLRIGR